MTQSMYFVQWFDPGRRLGVTVRLYKHRSGWESFRPRTEIARGVVTPRMPGEFRLNQKLRHDNWLFQDHP